MSTAAVDELPTALYYPSGSSQSGSQRTLHANHGCTWLARARNVTRCPASNPPRGSLCDACAPGLSREDVVDTETGGTRA